MSAKTVVTCMCGFKTGDRVTMISSFTKEDGSAPERMYGVVKDWGGGCGHIVSWDGNPYVATALPNPNVQRGGKPS